MIKKQTSPGKLLMFLSAVLIFLALLFLTDNKYYTDMPLPKNGVLHVSEYELEDAPIFLIDEWRFILNEADAEENESVRTWIGEFSNYRFYNELKRSPYGTGTYMLQVEYEGQPMVAALFFPNLCHDYKLWWDGALIAQGEVRAYEHIYLTPGIHTISISVSGDSGYYTGLYFPGAIGSDAVISHLILIQNTIYRIAVLVPLVLAVFCLSLWMTSGEVLRKYFAICCLCFAGSLSHYFLQLFQNPFAEYRFLISDIALYGMFYFAVKLMFEAAEIREERVQRGLVFVTGAVPAAEILLYIMASMWYDAIRLHGWIQNIYRIFLFGVLVWGGMQIRKKEGLSRFLLFCDSALGLGVLVNLFASNLFEPIYGLWQFEWCALLLVILFAVFLEKQNRQIILENQQYRQHLEALVEERTDQLTGLLNERRAFFSDMAHDLKAPLSSIKGFIYMIRSQNIGMDNELSLYLEQVDLQLKEMSQRVGSLNELNAVDRLEEKLQTVKVSELFEELYHMYHPDAVAAGVHLMVHPPIEDWTLRVQKRKILLAFENLIYNALRFTPMDGSVILEAEMRERTLCIYIKDTGCGIPAHELPYIFDRFYMGEYGKKTGGSGLGLYITRMIIREHGGEISAESVAGKGTVFILLFDKARLL